jgi:hypothetical protein
MTYSRRCRCSRAHHHEVDMPEHDHVLGYLIVTREEDSGQALVDVSSGMPRHEFAALLRRTAGHLDSR